MIENPEISICMPCFNASLFIAETLNSFLNQTYKNFEIIIVDDASTDDSLKILEHFSKIDNRIKIFKHEQNRGAAAARNLAFKNSKGNYIVFFDSDDMVNSAYLEKQLQLAKLNYDAIVACELLKFYNNDLNQTRTNTTAISETLNPIDWLLNDNAKGLNLTSCAMFFIPRKLIEQTNLWDERLSLIDDFEFFPRLLLTAKTIIYNPDSKSYYRRSINSSLSLSSGDKALQSAFDAIIATSQVILKRENSLRSRNALANYWSGWIYNSYGSNKKLYKLGLDNYKQLTGKNYNPKNSGVTGIFDSLIGWKLTKKIKNFVVK